jgi:predicted nucleic acid-binding protein
MEARTRRFYRKWRARRKIASIPTLLVMKRGQSADTASEAILRGEIMSLFEDAMSVAVQLPMGERERLARALGLNVHTRGAGQTLPLNQFVNRPADPSKTDPAAWRQAETGHAVLNTQTGESAAIEDGPNAVVGIWSHLKEAIHDAGDSEFPNVSSLAKGAPVLVHTAVVTDLAVGRAEAIAFFQTPPVEIRLATATYLALLGACENEEQVRRMRAFVQPFAVLSLGPMASSRAAELMLQHTSNGLGALDSLVAATAMAHEIPLVVRDSGAFAGIAELQVVKYF